MHQSKKMQKMLLFFLLGFLESAHLDVPIFLDPLKVRVFELENQCFYVPWNGNPHSEIFPYDIKNTNIITQKIWERSAPFQGKFLDAQNHVFGHHNLVLKHYNFFIDITKLNKKINKLSSINRLNKGQITERQRVTTKVKVLTSDKVLNQSNPSTTSSLPLASPLNPQNNKPDFLAMLGILPKNTQISKKKLT